MNLHPIRDKVDAMLAVRQYGNHPLTFNKGDRFCLKCDWIMFPPSYPGDFWDCANPKCGNSVSPTANQVRIMQTKSTIT